MPSACRLAAWTSALSLDQAPPEVVHKALRSIVDTAAVALAGASHSAVGQIREFVNEQYGAGACVVLGQERTVTACGAALANGMAAHVLDFDDTCYAGIAHGSAAVFPAVLASGQMLGASGADVLTGFIAGVETIYALGEALSDSIYMKGWWTTAVLGSIGAASGASRVLRLDTTQTAHAIALAASFAGGQRALLGTQGKPLGAGLAAEQGVRVAMLAARGLDGPRTVFEEGRGFAKLFNDSSFDQSRLLLLGRRFALLEPGVAIKVFPACSAIQAAGQALLTILARREARDVMKVQCRVTRLVAISLTYHDPKTISEAQFSLQFGLGCLLRFGAFTVEHLRREILSDEGLRSCMRRVEFEADEFPSLDADGNPQTEGAQVKVTFIDGSADTVSVGNATGTPQDPLTDVQLEGKFLACSSPVLGAERARVELDLLWALRHRKTARGLLGS
jgi:2-methylcitrate dehydratase PrpD